MWNKQSPLLGSLTGPSKAKYNFIILSSIFNTTSLCAEFSKYIFLTTVFTITEN